MNSVFNRLTIVSLLFLALFFNGCMKDNVEVNSVKLRLMAFQWRLFSSEYKGKEVYDSSYLNLLSFTESQGQDFYDSSGSADFSWSLLENKSTDGNLQLNISYRLVEIDKSIGGRFEILNLNNEYLEIKRLEPADSVPQVNWVKRYKAEI